MLQQGKAQLNLFKIIVWLEVFEFCYLSVSLTHLCHCRCYTFVFHFAHQHNDWSHDSTLEGQNSESTTTALLLHYRWL